MKFSLLVRRILGNSPNRVWILITLVGILGAFVGSCYLSLLWWLSAQLGPGTREFCGLISLLIFAGIGVSVSLITKWLGAAGSMELLVDNIHVQGGPSGIRELRALIPTSLLCIAAGGGAGPEAPLVQTTGTLASWLADFCGVETVDKRTLTITGMAAGFTVLFGAPIGAVFFSLEILHRRGQEYYESLMPAIVGSLCGYAAFTCLTGLGLAPVWSFPVAAPLRTVDLAWAFGAGAVGAVVAVLFENVCGAARYTFKKMPAWLGPVLGGIGLWFLAKASPYALTYGETQLGGIWAVQPAVWILAMAALAKFTGTALTVSSGWKGGFIIPLFFIGACLGRLGHCVFPATNEVMLTAALMAASNAGVTKTPLGSMLVVTGMTGVHLMPTTLIAAMVSQVLANKMLAAEAHPCVAHVGGAAEPA